MQRSVCSNVITISVKLFNYYYFNIKLWNHLYAELSARLYKLKYTEWGEYVYFVDVQTFNFKHSKRSLACLMGTFGNDCVN